MLQKELKDQKGFISNALQIHKIITIIFTGEKYELWSLQLFNKKRCNKISKEKGYGAIFQEQKKNIPKV